MCIYLSEDWFAKVRTLLARDSHSCFFYLLQKALLLMVVVDEGRRGNEEEWSG
jgi:hypothetical protein